MNNMVKPLISPALVNNIREKLEKVDHTAWSSIEYEVQDNAQCLFISVHLRQSTSLQARKQLLKLIYDPNTEVQETIRHLGFGGFTKRRSDRI